MLSVCVEKCYPFVRYFTHDDMFTGEYDNSNMRQLESMTTLT